MKTSSWRWRNRQVLRAGLIVAQWLLLTVALGAAVVRTEQTFEGLISPRFDSSSVFIGAFIASLLLGLTIESPRVLIPAVTLLCVGAALLFVIVLYVPAWEGTTLRTRALDNFAIDRSLVLMLLMSLPAAIGGLIGYLLGGLLDTQQEVLAHHDQDGPDDSWWSKRDDHV